MSTRKVIAIGNSEGVILPREVTAWMNVHAGDDLYITRSPGGGVTLTAADPEFIADMEAFDWVLREDKDILAALARQ